MSLTRSPRAAALLLLLAAAAPPAAAQLPPLTVPRGLLPAGLIEEIRALSQPPIPWDVELAQWFDHYFAPLERRRIDRPNLGAGLNWDGRAGSSKHAGVDDFTGPLATGLDFQVDALRDGDYNSGK